MPSYRILVVDNEEGMLEVCRDILERIPDVDIVLQRSSEKAVDQIRQEVWDLLITDIRMPRVDGVELVRIAKEKDPDMAAITMTAYPGVDTAVESMKLGATDYIVKPFHPDDFRNTVRRILDAKRLTEENRLLRRAVKRSGYFGEIVGASPAMARVYETIERVAPTKADVLIVGETGTGKELVAREIHRLSERRDQQFVPVDCGAIPDELLESEFFGYERGAFTGADSRSMGLLEFAQGGTFFLDEVGELTLRLQAKLLRALQERRVRRLGSNHEIDIDVRIIAATARNLEEEIEESRFRSDLYYRINVVRIEIPPLRDRREDIPLIADHFLKRYSTEMGHDDVTFEDEVMEVLAGFDWPGNVRELQNVVRRVLAVTRDPKIRVQHLPDEIVTRASSSAEPAGFFDLRDRHVAQFEKSYFIDLLRTYQGDVSAAANRAGIPRGTLYRLLNKHDIAPSDFRV